MLDQVTDFADRVRAIRTIAEKTSKDKPVYVGEIEGFYFLIVNGAYLTLTHPELTAKAADDLATFLFENRRYKALDGKDMKINPKEIEVELEGHKIQVMSIDHGWVPYEGFRLGTGVESRFVGEMLHYIYNLRRYRTRSF